LFMFANFRRLLRVVAELEHYRHDKLFAKLIANRMVWWRNRYSIGLVINTSWVQILLGQKLRNKIIITCGLTACTPGSSPGLTLDNAYGKALPF